MSDTSGMLASGFHPAESDGKASWHWSEPACRLMLPAGTRAAGLRVSNLFTTVTGRPLSVAVRQRATTISSRTLTGPPESIVLTGIDPAEPIELEVSPGWSPSEIFPANEDRRRLGFCLHGIDLVGAESCAMSFARLADYLGPGWLPPETDGASDWAWMGDEAVLIVPESARALTIAVACPHVERTGEAMSIEVRTHEGRLLGARGLAGPTESFVLPCHGEQYVVLRASRTWSPAEIYGGEDRRRLSVCLHGVFGMEPTSSFAPLSFEVELTTRCNINPPCVQCYPRMGPRDGEGRVEGEYIPPGLDMPRSLFDKIFPTMQEARVLSLHGVGEPLLTPLLRESLEKTDPARTYRQFNSNGLLLNARNCEFLIAAKTQYCNVSLDAATETTFRTVRGEGWPIIMRNLKAFAETKKRMGVSHPLIAINMTLMKVNFREAPAFVDLAIDLGVDRVIFSKLEPAEDYFMERKGFFFRYKDQYVDKGDAEFKESLDRALARGREAGVETIAIVPNIFG